MSIPTTHEVLAAYVAGVCVHGCHADALSDEAYSQHRDQFEDWFNNERNIAYSMGNTDAMHSFMNNTNIEFAPMSEAETIVVSETR